MYLFVIFSSLFSSLLIGLFGKYLGRQASVYIIIFIMIITILLSLLILLEILITNNIVIIDLYNLFIINDIRINIGFLFDPLTSVMLLVVIGISLLVHIFTVGYMGHDPFIIRFYTYLGFFTFFMIVLITSDNFLQLFVG